MNATMGNAPELIISLFALKEGLLRVVQVSLLGSILSNLLLVLGTGFLLGGLKFTEQRFNAATSHLNAGLLLLAVMCLLLPAVLVASNTEIVGGASALLLSRMVSIVMLLLYFAYLYFTLGTHSEMVEEDARVSALATRASSMAVVAGGGGGSGGAANGGGSAQCDGDDDDEEAEVPTVSLLGAMLSLTVLTVVISIASEALTGSIETVAKRTGISTAFISVIILPIAGNAAEHLTAVVVAAKGKMDLAQSIALGSSLQISMLALPFAVLVAW